MEQFWLPKELAFSGDLPFFAWSVPSLQGRSDLLLPCRMCIRFLSMASPALMGCNGTFGGVVCVCRAESGHLQENVSLCLTQLILPPLPLQIYQGKIKNKATEPTPIWHNPRVEFVGSTTKKDNNISIVLNGVEFSDAGKYTCHVKNPKERNAQHNATIFLTVVHKSECWPLGWHWVGGCANTR